MAIRSSRSDVDAEWLTLACACANVRRLARLATRLYDDALRGSGMEIGQFGLTTTIARMGHATQAQLARGLAMDTTSLTRTLAVMQKRGWIEKQIGVDRRSRVFAVTAEGLAQLARARPDWLRAQQRLAAALGAPDSRRLVRLVEDVSLALHEQLAVSDAPAATGAKATTPGGRSTRGAAGRRRQQRD